MYRNIPEKTIRTVWIITAVAGLYYVFIITNGTFDLFGSEVLGLVFNSMFSNMLHGDFSIDPVVLRYENVFEAMVKDGKTYMYFGVFPAFIRVFFAPFVDMSATYVSRISVLFGLFLSTIFQVKTLLRVFCAFEPVPFVTRLFYILLICLLFCNPNIFIASNASVYHEPIIWASAAVAVFNYLLIDTALKRKPITLAVLNLMAVVAGICLLSRVNVAIGIYMGVVGLIFYFSCRKIMEKSGRVKNGKDHSDESAAREVTSRKLAVLRMLFTPLAILFIFGVAYLYVNYARWGNPFMSSYFDGYAERSKALEKYGILNTKRIPFAVKYYLGGIEAKSRLTRTEGPRVSMAVTNSIFLLLGIFGIFHLLLLAKDEVPFSVPIIIGMVSQGVTVIFAFMFAALTLRYRMDLWGFVFLCTMIGFYFVARKTASMPKQLKTSLLTAAVVLMLFGVASNQLTAVKYKLMWLSMEKPKSEITEILQSVVEKAKRFR